MATASAPITAPGELARREQIGRERRIPERAVGVIDAVGRGGLAATASLALAVAATLVYGRGYLGFDAGWAMLWGDQLAAGQLPDFHATGAPTPHPLANVAAALLSPLGDAAGPVFVALGALSFGLLTVASYLLGSRLFGRLAGVLFAAIVFTRAELVALQGEAPIDVPFLAFVVLGAALEAERPRRGGAVLALLGLAGLLRPEAWLFAAAYALYVVPARPDLRSRVGVLAAAAVAPCAWAAFDLVVTGDPLYSLHGTQQLALELERPRGPASALAAMPTALIEHLGTPLAIAGIAGCGAALLLLYRRALLPLALVGLGLCCFVAVGLAGLPVLNRYFVVPVVMLALFAAVALAGWRRLERVDPRRAPWMACAGVIACMVGAGAPSDVERDRLAVELLAQQRVGQRDLHALAANASLANLDGRQLHISTRRALPLIATWLDLPLAALSANEPSPGERALVIRPATPLVDAMFRSATTPVWSPGLDGGPTGVEIYRNDSWVLYATRP